MEHQWVDISAIPAPEAAIETGWLLVTLLATIAVAVIVIFRQTRPSQRAIRQIKSLHKKIGRAGLDNKLLLQELEKILCHRFVTSQLSQVVMSDSKWKVFKTKLTTACYRPEQPDSELTQGLLNDAINLIKTPGNVHGAG
jgi:hypothetical protein